MTERPTRTQLNLSASCEFQERAPGDWLARFPLLGVEATGESRNGAFVALFGAIQARTQSDPDARARWDEFIRDNTVEVEMTDEEIRREDDVLRRSREASSGFRALTPSTFADAIVSERPLLVDFWAEWCKPCHMLAPTLAEAYSLLADRMDIAKVNVDEDDGISDRLGVKSIPTLVLFVAGRERARIVGSGHSKDEIVAQLEPHL